MASLLERMNISTEAGGPVRSRGNSSRGASAPYSRTSRPSKGDVEGQWSHDLFDNHNSLSARLNLASSAPKATIGNIAQRAIKDATALARSDTNAGGPLSIKGASSSGNVVEVTGLVTGTTPDDVAAIFKQCGVVTDQKAMSKKNEDPRIRITFKTPAAAAAAVKQFNNRPADGRILSVKVVGSSGASLAGRLGGADGLGLVREEGTVDVLMDSSDTGSKMRSDSLVKADPRAQVLVAPPGANPSDYTQSSWERGYGRRGGRGRGSRRGGPKRGGIASRMDLD
ncbi:hypothetical protein CPB83DRAFT_857582 [Crepidotus variabilis]|uniref:RRM domain-containing protein n=1 Tax=Crepidotus variabilis TaxID=179855 RepID=A0A9P6ECP8_9AGAR|nr:hypothetical protein CPB83DRAFT_857582 [Crepidotus variabilis]